MASQKFIMKLLGNKKVLECLNLVFWFFLLFSCYMSWLICLTNKCMTNGCYTNTTRTNECCRKVLNQWVLDKRCRINKVWINGYRTGPVSVRLIRCNLCKLPIFLLMYFYRSFLLFWFILVENKKIALCRCCCVLISQAKLIVATDSLDLMDGL